MMTTTEQMDFILNQTEPSGSNYPSGYRQGDFFLPESGAQGVPVGMVHPFVAINIPATPVTPLTTINVTEETSFFLPLGNITPVANAISLVYPDDGSPYLEMTIPRGVTIFTNNGATAGTVIFSGEDDYKNPMVWQQTISDFPSINGRVPKKIFSAYVTVSSYGGDAVFSLNITDEIELPYTDYNITSEGTPFILSATLTNPAPSEYPVVPDLIQIPDTNSYAFNFSYAPATWTTPLTLENGLPRPVIIYPWNGNNLTIWFCNFGFQNTEFINDFIQPIAEIYQGSEFENEYYIFGLPQYVDSNFTTWQG